MGWGGVVGWGGESTPSSLHPTGPSYVSPRATPTGHRPPAPPRPCVLHEEARAEAEGAPACRHPTGGLVPVPLLGSQVLPHQPLSQQKKKTYQRIPPSASVHTSALMCNLTHTYDTQMHMIFVHKLPLPIHSHMHSLPKLYRKRRPKSSAQEQSFISWAVRRHSKLADLLQSIVLAEPVPQTVRLTGY